MGFRAHDSGFRAQGFDFMAQGLGFIELRLEALNPTVFPKAFQGLRDKKWEDVEMIGLSFESPFLSDPECREFTV